MTSVVYEWCGRRGASLATLIESAPVQLDAEGIREAFGEVEATGRTCIQGARRVVVPRCERESPRPLHPLLEHACRPFQGKKLALALSGGLDSAVLAALFRDSIVAYTLSTPFPGYCEAREAGRMASHLGIELRLVRATEEDFLHALPEAVRLCESPLYNLHPVSRYLVARAARADGFDALITGDGADELFSDRSGADYLPIVSSLAHGIGITPIAPFCDPELAPFIAVDSQKRELRRLARSLGIPDDVSQTPKRARFAPRMNLDSYWDTAVIHDLARSIGRIPHRDSDREYVGWPTLALLVRSFPNLGRSCAA